MKNVLWACLLGIFLSAGAWAETQDPMVCLGEIERVCAHLDDKLETCLSDRGDQLSATCREELKTAIKMMQDPSGPATCVPDIQRLCPDLKPQALAQCVKKNQDNLSPACKTYLQKAAQNDNHS